MSDLSEDISRVLAYEQIITWEGVALYWFITPRSLQGQIKVISSSNWQKYWKCPLLSISDLSVVPSSTRKDWFWHILRVSFPHTFLGNLGQCWYWRGWYLHVFLITPPSSRLNWTSKITIMQQRVASACVSISKYWYIVGYEGWHGLRWCFTALIPPKSSAEVIPSSCKMSRLSIYGWWVLNA